MKKIEEAHEDFVKHLKSQGKSSATVIAYEKDIEQLKEQLLKQGLEHVHEITLDHLKEFMDRMKELGLTNKTVSRKTNATKTFFRYLKDESHIQVNVADNLKHPKVNIKPPRILSKLEYRALRDTARDDKRTFAIIEVLLQTGASISELSLIEIDHIEIKDNETTGTLKIPARQSKDSRKVPLNKAVLESIKDYINNHRASVESRYLFVTKTGNPLLVRNIRSTIDRYFKIAGIENAKVNDLRHTFIAHHLTQGTSLQTVSKIVGHKRISTTEKYLEYIERETEEEKMELGVL